MDSYEPLIISRRMLPQTSDKSALVNVTWEGDFGTSFSLFSHPYCRSLPMSSIPLHFLLHIGVKVICLNEVLMLSPLQFIKKKKKSSHGPSCFLCKPFRIEQKFHHLTYEVLPNQAQPLTQDSHYPSSHSPFTFAEHPSAWTFWLPIPACTSITHSSLRPSQHPQLGTKQSSFSLYLSILEVLSVNLNKFFSQ